MHQSPRILLSTVICVSAGCHSISKPRNMMQTQLIAAIDGVAVLPAPNAAAKTTIDFGDIRVNRQGYQRVLQAGDAIETKHVIRLSIHQTVNEETHDYQAVFAPTLGTNGTASGTIVNSVPTLFMSRGWSFFWGILPYAKTKWVTAGGVGTVMAMQIVDRNTQRVYLALDSEAGSKVVVTCNDGSSTKTLSVLGTFVEVTAGCSISEPKITADDSSAKDFMADAGRIARSAGW